VDNLYRGVCRVHALAAFARRATNIDFDFVRLDFNIHFLGFGQHGDRRSAGVNTPLRLRGRDTLHPMHTALVFKTFVNVLSVDLENYFLEAA
jgi:hypothetical protein